MFSKIIIMLFSSTKLKTTCMCLSTIFYPYLFETVLILDFFEDNLEMKCECTLLSIEILS